jgi:hypothetical protein
MYVGGDCENVNPFKLGLKEEGKVRRNHHRHAGNK